MLVSRDQDDPGVWQRAVEIGADHVLVLPDGEQWLVDRIADVAEGVGRPALTVGVIGGRGGAGASTLACALAVTAAREGCAASWWTPIRWAAASTSCSGRDRRGTEVARVRGLARQGRRGRPGGVTARAARAAGPELGPR